MCCVRFTATASVLLLAGCGVHPEPAKPTGEKPSPPIAVRTVPATVSDWPAVYEATGTIRARTTTAIAARVMAYVREVKARVGDRVQAGQLLVLLDDRDLDSRLRQAQAGLAEARNAIPEADSGVAAARAQLDLASVTARRMQDLFEKKSVSNQELDEALARVRTAEAHYQMAEARRGQLGEKIKQAEQAVREAELFRAYSELRAPAGGVVTERNVEPGNLASPGVPLMMIEAEGAFRLEARVEESRLALLAVGQSVPVRLDAVAAVAAGRVAEIVPVGDAGSRSFTVKIDLPAQSGLRSGMFGRVRLTLPPRRALAVPDNALQERGQVQTVMVAAGGLAQSRLVTTGERSGDRVEVLSGLQEGEVVVAPLPPGLADGARLEVRP